MKLYKIEEDKPISGEEMEKKLSEYWGKIYTKWSSLLEVDRPRHKLWLLCSILPTEWNLRMSVNVIYFNLLNTFFSITYQLD